VLAIVQRDDDQPRSSRANAVSMPFQQGVQIDLQVDFIQILLAGFDLRGLSEKNLYVEL
jgi:hypothetical protein